MQKHSRKRDKRQWLLLHLKRVMRQRWFFKLVITVVWKIYDHFTP
ncbi:hypothetical protein HDE79_000684 [Rhodanobacter sp. MP1X3]|nr:hypothetical protein [Rhodanobacter sp. MP1X3]